MHCTSCGGEAPPDSQFCPHCGTQLSGEDDSPGAGPEDQAAGLRRTTAAFRRSDGEHPPEEDLWTGTYSPKAMCGSVLAAVVLSVGGLVIVPLVANTTIGWRMLVLGLLVMWGGLALVLAYRRLSVGYRLTTYRLFHERGLLSRTTDRLEVIDIDDVRVHQGLVERMLGVGTVKIESSDRTDPELSLPGIDEVRAVADLIDNTRRAERERRGLHIEAV
jgi:membrane protein YdbS with pleckstrin-like domain